MRKFLCNLLFALFTLAVLLPMRVRAAGADAFGLDESGMVTIVSQHAAKEKISSLGFSLYVESENAVRAEFQFETGNAEILEFRYDEVAGKLNIYVAGTEALFAEGTDSLVIGRIVVLDANGVETVANVSVVEDSLQYVYGTELRTMQDIELPGVVQVGAAGKAPSDGDTPSGGDTPTDGDTPSGGDTPTDGDTPSGGDSSPEGTQTPAVTPAPAAGKVPTATKVPVVAQQPSPTPEVTEKPQATETPAPSSAPVDDSSSEDSSEASLPDSMSGISGDTGQMTDDKMEEEHSEPQGINKVFLIVVVLVIILAVAGGIVFILLKKKPKELENQEKG